MPTIYVRRQTRHRLKVTSLLILGLVIFTPQFELPETPQLMAFFDTTLPDQPLGG